MDLLVGVSNTKGLLLAFFITPEDTGIQKSA